MIRCWWSPREAFAGLHGNIVLQFKFPLVVKSATPYEA